MVTQTVVLVGVPDTGKTNFIIRLWLALCRRKGALACPSPPDNIKYVEDGLGHVLQGSFAPRSNKNIGESRSDTLFMISMSGAPDRPLGNLLVPDVTGELWRRAVATFELPVRWMEDLKRASGAMLFVRALSDEIVAPLDWITSRELLRGTLSLLPKEKASLPTQVELCELLRFLELSLKQREDGSLARVAIIVTAYDRLDHEAATLGPSHYLEREYPLFAGRLHDANTLSIRIFGASIVGGDLDIDEEFRSRYLHGEMSNFGYIAVEQNGAIEKIADMTLPLAWLMRGDS